MFAWPVCRHPVWTSATWKVFSQVNMVKISWSVTFDYELLRSNLLTLDNFHILLVNRESCQAMIYKLFWSCVKKFGHLIRVLLVQTLDVVKHIPRNNLSHHNSYLNLFTTHGRPTRVNVDIFAQERVQLVLWNHYSFSLIKTINILKWLIVHLRQW